MRIVIAPDSFKESASAVQVCNAIERGLRRSLPDAEIVSVPMADGGEGTVDALVAATRGILKAVTVRGPLGGSVDASFGMSGDSKNAFIEMAAASGLMLVPADLRDPGVATTFGTGELLRRAIDAGAQHIVMGIGGSATNDGGAGMAQALGYALLDEAGRELGPGGLALSQLAQIDVTNRHPRLQDVDICVAADVDNPLCGPNGASAVYGPQKGASSALIDSLDRALVHFAAVIERDLGISVLNVSGAGAAGGLGAGLLAFAGAQMGPGVELVAEACGLAETMSGADLVITGEGRLDSQSLSGKTPVGVARLAKKQGIRVIAFVGTLDVDETELRRAGIDAAYAIGPLSLAKVERIARVGELLEEASAQFGLTWKTSNR